MKKKVVVIGSGPAGYTAALEGSRAGMDVVLIESHSLGGVCVNYGCVPSKSYLKLIKAREQLVGTGSVPAQEVEGLRRQMKDVKTENVSRLQYGIHYLVQRGSIQLVQGRAAIDRERHVLVERTSGEQESIDCDAVILATGSREKRREFDKCYRIHSLEQLILLEGLPEEISIIGGGVLGVELAVILQAIGVKTNLLEKEPRILPSWDEEVSRQMEIYLGDRDINVETSNMKPVCKDVVVCSGREPILPDMAEKIRGQLNVKDGEIEADQYYSIGPDWLYAVGDCVAKDKEANIAMAQGRAVIDLISGKKDAVRISDFPPARCIYTPLEAATAGRTKTELEAEGIQCAETFYPITQTASGMISGLDQGFIKVVMEAGSHVLRGFHLMTCFGSELIMACQMAVELGMTAESFTSFVFPHPTECELLKEAVYQLLREAR